MLLPGYHSQLLVAQQEGLNATVPNQASFFDPKTPLARICDYLEPNPSIALLFSEAERAVRQKHEILTSLGACWGGFLVDSLSSHCFLFYLSPK